jgi:2-oxo-3-hexenedioate decarboxylase
MPDLKGIASRLIAAQDGVRTLPPITTDEPAFSVADAYAVLHDIEQRRTAQGWRAVGRKIGFTNRTIWPRYGVYEPIWAHIWSHTVHFAKDDRAVLDLKPFVQPRIEPEVVFKLNGPVPDTDEPEALLSAVEWLAPGFEIVQSHFPDWKFRLPDCTAAFGLHGALVVGTPMAITAANRAALTAALRTFTLTLSRGGAAVDYGVGANVLDGPPFALAHLTRVLAGLPQFAPLKAGEYVTTGTITDAWPVTPGETWSSNYGTLGLNGLTLSCEGPRR